jgi:hypothetical protein
MTVGTGITGELNSGLCGRVLVPSGYKCCTEVCTAKEKAVFAFGSRVGFERSGRLNNVTCDSWGLSECRGMRSEHLRTGKHDERIYILYKSKLVDSSSREALLGLQMGYSVGIAVCI